MLIFTKILDLQAFLSAQRQAGKTIGFVPTMGALHKGHLSLIGASVKECGTTVCSIFVNPTQFNDPRDLDRYPRTPEKDTELLRGSGCDALFIPEANEIYPGGPAATPDLGRITQVLEGTHRPGHFEGVAQVVKRLFEAVEPDVAFFGSKDFQQVLVIKELVKKVGFPIRIVACPVIRETDGLAMSSRNTLLTADERKKASLIPKTLKKAIEIAKKEGIIDAKRFLKAAFDADDIITLEYFEICDTQTLEPLNENNDPQGAIALLAVRLNKIRLIDNMPV